MAVEPISLQFGQIVQDRGRTFGWIVFPRTAVLCVRANDPEGESCEVGSIGNEGAFGVDAALGSLALRATSCQVAGTALRMHARIFTALQKELPHFSALIGATEQAHSYLTEQLVACNTLHVLDQRAARWMLVMADRTHCEHFPITHEYLAAMLGVRRPAITLTESRLQAAGAISYRYGMLRIVDRSLLESLACQCYREVSEVFNASVSASDTRPLVRYSSR